MSIPISWTTAPGFIHMITGATIKSIDYHTYIAKLNGKIIVLFMDISEGPSSQEMALLWLIEDTEYNRDRLSNKILPDQEPYRTSTVEGLQEIVRQMI